jgi:glucose-6-phosphate isomerase
MQRLPFHDWVGGRFSLWSSVGCRSPSPSAWPRFEQLLAGAHAADLHSVPTRSSATCRRCSARRRLEPQCLGIASHAVLSYASRLESLPAYLQQLEMESNGKRVDRDGNPLDFATCPVIWGGTETPGQHAFHQWLHQGTDSPPATSSSCAQPMGAHAEHHEILLAHACAQSEALMAGSRRRRHMAPCPATA